MNLTLEQKDLINRILLNMNYDNRKTLSENKIFEQKNDILFNNTSYLPEPKTRIDNLSNNELLKIAKKWGWDEFEGIPVSYDDKNKSKLKIEYAKNFLQKIGWPKFGIPPNSKNKIPIQITNKKILMDNIFKTKNIDVNNQIGYRKCIDFLNIDNSFNNLPLIELESYSNEKEYCKYNYELYTPKYDDVTWGRSFYNSLNDHDFLMTVSLVTGVLSFIPSPLAPVFAGISLSADLRDAYLYHKEGDDYMATILFGLSIIPGHQLFKELKSANTFKKIGVEETKKIAKKSLDGTATKNEINTFKQITKELLEEPKILSQLTKKALIFKLIKELSKKSLKFIANFILAISKLIWGVTKSIVIPIAGIYYTFDEIYLAIFADDINALEIRKFSEIQQLIHFIKNDEKYFKEELINYQVKKSLKIITEKNIDVISVNVDEEASKKEIEEYIKNLGQKNEKK